MPLYNCDCGFGSSSGATGESITQHLKGCHDREINVSSRGFYFCNECSGRSGNGRRFPDFPDLLEHLEDRHNLDCVNSSPCLEYDEMLFQCTDCSFGSTTGARRLDLVNHIRGSHSIDVRYGSYGYHCNDCTRRNGNGKRFESFEDLMDHLENTHGYQGFQEFS